MHAIKGAWAGQTFALAKCNESEGRKSRIRRSKEERKTMVESFIKTYQSSNNGHFPSLNLTHKEVGGSFYTVREIVREVIQENRVLGPAKFSPEEQQLQNADNFFEQYPLGSISCEPQIPLTSSLNGTSFASDYQSTGGEVVATTDELSSGPEHHGLNNGRVNGSQIDMKNDNANNLRCIELQVSEPSEPTMNLEGETVASKIELNLVVSEPMDAKESLEEEIDASKDEPDLLVSEPSNVKKSLEEQMVASEAKLSPLVSGPLNAKESLEEQMVASETKVSVLVSEPSEAKESLQEEMIVSEAKGSLPVSETSEAKESLQEEMIVSEAKVSVLVSEPSEAKESLQEDMIVSEAKVSVLVSEPSEAKESSREDIILSVAKLSPSEPLKAKERLEEQMVASEVKVSVLVSEPSEANESLQEEIVVSKAKVSLPVSEPSEAKESLQEEMIVSEAKVSVLVSEPSEAKESSQEEIILSEAKVNPLVRKPLEAKENLGKGFAVSKAKVDPLATDVIVEVFPVRPIAKSTDNLAVRSGEVKDATSTLEKTEALLENSNRPTTKEDVMHQSGIVAEVKTINGACELKSNEEKAVASNGKTEARPRGRSKKEATPTLDRINLKSWEDPSRNPEKNPLVSIFQSFIAAFMKLWSE